MSEILTKHYIINFTIVHIVIIYLRYTSQWKASERFFYRKLLVVKGLIKIQEQKVTICIVGPRVIYNMIKSTNS